MAAQEKISRRVAVVGAGPSGISALRALATIEDCEVVCYDKQPQFGGMWVYNPNVGRDERGGPVPSGMYRELWTNGPKECLEFPDFTFQECFTVATPSFISREVMLRYIQKYVEKFDLAKHMVLDTSVEAVTYDDQTQKFTVTVKSWKGDQQVETSSVFDNVVVAAGHFSEPNYPGPYPEKTPYDLSAFTGKVMHAGELRDLHIFKGLRVLSVGSSYSSEAIIMEAPKHGCIRAVNTWRSNPIGFVRESQSDGKADEHPLPTKIEGKMVTFGDGHQEEFDLIVLCTGYKHVFPYMKDGLELKCKNEMYCENLYKGVLLETNPKVAYIGAQDLFYTFTLFWAQGMWLKHVFEGSIQVPTRYDERVAQSVPWRERNANLASDEDFIKIQGAHIADLCADFNGPDLNTDDMFIQWEHDRHENIFTHRECIFPSKFTGQMASKPGKTWWDSWTPRDYLGDEVADAIKLDEWILEVGGSHSDFRPKEMKEAEN